MDTSVFDSQNRYDRNRPFRITFFDVCLGKAVPGLLFWVAGMKTGIIPIFIPEFVLERRILYHASKQMINKSALKANNLRVTLIDQITRVRILRLIFVN